MVALITEDLKSFHEIIPASKLVHVIYFKGRWANQFAVKDTTNRPFYVDINTVKQVPTMYRKGNYKYVELSDYNAKCIELPYAVMLFS